MGGRLTSSLLARVRTHDADSAQHRRPETADVVTKWACTPRETTTMESSIVRVVKALPLLIMATRTRSVILAASLVAATACAGELTSPTHPAGGAERVAGAAAAATEPVIVMLAGDLHACLTAANRSQATAAIIEQYPQALVIPLGDNAGQSGTAAEYQCYDRSWGKFKSRTYPTLGNHELNLDPTATAYYDYFNGVGVDSGRAGSRGRGYYALDYGGWRIFVANFNYGQHIDDQEAWMARELVAHPTQCTMAVWHRPLFVSSSQPAGVQAPSKLTRWWWMLYNGGADLVINGHSHLYERFAEMRQDGVVDTDRGLREFVVGTGGSGLFTFDAVPRPGSRKRLRTWGVLKLTLWPTHYRWEFIDVAGVVRDSGGDTCH